MVALEGTLAAKLTAVNFRTTGTLSSSRTCHRRRLEEDNDSQSQVASNALCCLPRVHWMRPHIIHSPLSTFDPPPPPPPPTPLASCVCNQWLTNTLRCADLMSITVATGNSAPAVHRTGTSGTRLSSLNDVSGFSSPSLWPVDPRPFLGQQLHGLFR